MVCVCVFGQAMLMATSSLSRRSVWSGSRTRREPSSRRRLKAPSSASNATSASWQWYSNFLAVLVQVCTKKLTQKELQQGRSREDVFALLALLVQKYKVLTLRAAFQGFLGPERTIIDELNLAQDNRSNIRLASTKVHILTQLLVP